MGAPSTPSVESLIGRRGRLIGSHPWAGHSGEIVRVEKTIVGWGAIVRLDGQTQEVFVFDGRNHWRPEPPKGGPKMGTLVIGDWPGPKGGAA